MELKEECRRIAQASGRGEQGAVASSPQAPKKPRFSPPLERNVKSQGPRLLEFLAEAAAGEQEGHRYGWTVQGRSLTVPREDWVRGTMMGYVVYLCC